jgi:hypothetical protein
MTRKELLNSPEYWQTIAENQCYRENIDYTLQLVDKKQMMDKIVKWIDENAFEYVKTETVGIMENYKRFESERMIADLIKAMEE